jgi:hypothetical protein
VYAQPDPAVLVRVQGMAPLRATVYELARRTNVNYFFRSATTILAGRHRP